MSIALATGGKFLPQITSYSEGSGDAASYSARKIEPLINIGKLREKDKKPQIIIRLIGD